jgi:hypothetical protein
LDSKITNEEEKRCSFITANSGKDILRRWSIVIVESYKTFDFNHDYF